MSIDIEAVKARTDCRRLADDLGVTITARRGQWWTARCPTPGHADSSPSCGISATGWRCHGCSAGGSVIDLWMAVTGTDDVAAAIDALGRWAGIDEGEPPPVRRSPRPVSDEVETVAPGEVEAARAVLAQIWEGLALEDDAAAYLRGRGIDPEVAAVEGVRSVPQGAWPEMVAGFSDDELEAAGIWESGRGFLQPFWHRATAFLALPFCDTRGQIASLRFRRTAGEGPKALGLLSSAVGDLHRPPLPFGAPGQIRLAARRGAPLYIVEGELDALSIITAGRHAIAAPGASSWRDQWCSGWEDLDAVIVLADGDEAGEGLAERVAEAAAEELGPPWLRDRLHLCAAGEGLDPGDLLEAGELRDALESLERQRGWTSPTIPPWETAV